MLKIRRRTKKRARFSIALLCIGILILLSGLYLLSLTAAPFVAPLIARKPIDASTLPKPIASENRVIIPKIGVNIHYAPGEAALNAGAEWRHPERGNPERGGNFIIAAHRLSIQPTPWGTIEKSPFYDIDKLAIGDKILIDYLGVRYAYKINMIYNVKPNQIEIEAPSETPKLTLYSCDLTGAATGRVVINGELMGKVALITNE